VPRFALTELLTFGYANEEEANDENVHALQTPLQKLKLLKDQIAEFLRLLDTKR
jgi:hypothetical protein